MRPGLLQTILMGVALVLFVLGSIAADGNPPEIAGLNALTLIAGGLASMAAAFFLDRLGA